MNQIVYCAKGQARTLLFSTALAPLEKQIVFRGERGRRHVKCVNDSVVIWWAPHNTLEDFKRLLSVEMSELRPSVVLFAPPAEMRQYLDLYASCWPDKLGNLKIFSSDAPVLDEAASAAMTGKLAPTGKCIQSEAFSEIILNEPNRWLCNYDGNSDTTRRKQAESFELNPYEHVHALRYVLGNAMLGEDFKLLLYAHKKEYLPKWIASDLVWWPNSLKKKLWLVLYTGGEVSDISETAHPEITKIKSILSGRFARHSGFMQANLLKDHEAKFDNELDFDPELPAPIILNAISILCQASHFAGAVKKWPEELCEVEQFWSPIAEVDNLEAKLRQETRGKPLPERVVSLVRYLDGDISHITPEFAGDVVIDVGRILGLERDAELLENEAEVAQLMQSVASDERNIYVAGTSVYSKALYQSLVVLLGETRVFLVQSTEPKNVALEMRKTQKMGTHVREPGQDCCILDCSMVMNASKECGQFVNQMRGVGNPDLRWEGPLIALVKDRATQLLLNETDLFGGYSEDAALFTNIDGHTSLALSVPFSKLLESIASSPTIRTSKWNAKLSKGAIPCFLRAANHLEAALSAGNTKNYNPLKKELLKELNRFAGEGAIKIDFSHNKASRGAVLAANYFRSGRDCSEPGAQEIEHIHALRQYAESRLIKQRRAE